MPNLAWPALQVPAGIELRLQKSGAQFRSQYTGSFQAVSFVGEFWEAIIQFRAEGRMRVRSNALHAFIADIAGGTTLVDVYDWTRPVPRGTLRGTPTIKTATVRGDTSLVLNTVTGYTLEAGDLIGAGTQLFMVKSKCVAAASEITVPIVNRVRGVIAENSAVTWNKPTIGMVMPEMSAGLGYRPGYVLPTEIRLVEP